MANALTPSSNLTPNQNHHYLNQWPTYMNEDIWHFNQCAGIGAPVQTANDKGGTIYLQKEREMIARSLENAAARMAQDLNYWLCPAYFSELIPLGRGVPLQNQVFQGRFCKMIELGKRATALIQAGAAVVYSDPNSIGVDDTATITIVTAIANDEIRLFYRVTDGAPTAADYRYEIEPIQVTDNGAGTVTITAHRSLFVKPTEWKREYTAFDPNFNSPNVVDTANAANFVTAVDVYRVYTDTSDNIELLSADNTLLQTYTGDIVDDELSAFRMGDLCSNVCWDQWPKKIRVNYKAGSPLVNGNFDNELMEACFAYACANMTNELTKMSYWTLTAWERYQRPMVESIGGSLIPVATKMQSNSGYGARTGQVLAWTTVMDRRIERGHKLTYSMR